MPGVATLKNAYRDRPVKNRRHNAEEDEDEEDDNDLTEFKVPQSFTFMNREGRDQCDKICQGRI